MDAQDVAYTDERERPSAALVEAPDFETPAPILQQAGVPTLREVYWMAKALTNAVTLPAALRGKPADVLAVMLAGRELGIGPMAATRMVHIINGQTSVATELKLALAARAGHEVAALREGPGWCVVGCTHHRAAELLAWAMTGDEARHASNDLRAAARGADATSDVAELLERCARALDGATVATEVIVESWEGERGNRRKAEAPLTDKSNWRSYQRNMLFWRASADFMRRHSPALAGGLYTVEELGGDGEA